MVGVMTDEPLIELTPDGVRAMLKPREHTSYSQLEKFSSCPARTAAETLIESPLRPADPRMVGKLVHAMLERTAGADGRLPRDRAGWRKVGERAVAETADGPARNRLVPEDDEPDEWLDLAVGRLERFHLDLPLDPAQPEREILSNAWGVPLRAFVDYTDKTGMILDWKTGKPYPSHGDQLRVYTQLLREMGETVPWAADVYVDTNKITAADLTAKALTQTGDWAKKNWDGLQSSIASGRFAYGPSYLCPWCPLARACPMAEPPRGGKAREAAALALDPTDPRLTVAAPPRGAFKPIVDKPKEHAMTITEGRPYEPTLTNDTLNLAGYAMAALYDTTMLADRLTDGKDLDRVAKALVLAQLKLAHAVWPERIGEPDWSNRAGILAALDSSVARDARRILFDLLEHDPALREGDGGRTVESVLAATLKALDKGRAIMETARRISDR